MREWKPPPSTLFLEVSGTQIKPHLFTIDQSRAESFLLTCQPPNKHTHLSFSGSGIQSPSMPKLSQVSTHFPAFMLAMNLLLTHLTQ